MQDIIKKIIEITKDYIQNLIKCIIRDDFGNAAGEMAYMTALGIFPFMLFIMAVFGFLGKTFFINKVIFGLSTIAPESVITLINGVLNEVVIFKSGRLMAFIGFFVTLFLTHNAIAVIIKGLNRANNVAENRSFLQVRALAVMMVFVNTFFLFICISLIVLGRVILNFIGLYLQIPDNIINMIFLKQSIRTPLSQYSSLVSHPQQDETSSVFKNVQDLPLNHLFKSLHLPPIFQHMMFQYTKLLLVSLTHHAVPCSSTFEYAGPFTWKARFLLLC